MRPVGRRLFGFGGWMLAALAAASAIAAGARAGTDLRSGRSRTRFGAQTHSTQIIILEFYKF
jgi:hypothetical protein